MKKKILYILLIATLITSGIILLENTENRTQKTEEIETTEEPQEIGREEVETAIKLAGEKLKDDLKTNGQFNYIYDHASDYTTDSYSMVRHISGSNALVALYKFTKDESYIEAAKTSIDFFMQYLITEGDKSYILYKYENENADTGSQALALITLINYENETGDIQYSDTITQLANFLLSIQNEDGSYKNYYPKDDPDYAMATELFTGEANFAIMHMLERTGETKYLAALQKSYDFVKNYFESTYSSPIVSWNSNAFARLYKYTDNAEYADLVIEMTDWLRNLQYKEDNIDDPLYVGGFRTEDPEQWLTCTTGAFGEGINAGLSAIRDQGDKDLEESYDETISLAIKYLLSVQHEDGSFNASPSQEWVRIDFNTHAIMTLLGALENYVY